MIALGLKKKVKLQSPTSLSIWVLFLGVIPSEDCQPDGAQEHAGRDRCQDVRGPDLGGGHLVRGGPVPLGLAL